MMIERNYGSHDGRQLCLRWFVPCWFCRWEGKSFVGRWRMDWKALLSLDNWRRAWKYETDNRFSARRYAHSTHRCYCATGWSYDGSMSLMGFQVQWFYSHFTGKLPCPCDEAFEEMEAEDESIEAGVLTR
jgi:hypothetical protein